MIRNHLFKTKISPLFTEDAGNCSENIWGVASFDLG